MSEDINSNSATRLKSIIERVENLEEEKKNINNDIKDVFGEASAEGFDAKILRKIVSMRKKPKAERENEETILETYLMALGMA